MGHEQIAGFPCHPSVRSLLAAIRSSLHLIHSMDVGRKIVVVNFRHWAVEKGE
jgi:hypothetical protein